MTERESQIITLFRCLSREQKQMFAGLVQALEEGNQRKREGTGNCQGGGEKEKR